MKNATLKKIYKLLKTTTTLRSMLNFPNLTRIELFIDNIKNWVMILIKAHNTNDIVI